MENIDKNSVFWNHMSDEEKKMFVEITQNASNIVDDEENIQITNESNIMEQDIKASEEILNEIQEIDKMDELDETFNYNWEEEFFKKFDWLDQSTIEKNNEMMKKTKYNLFLDCCKILENQFSITDEPDLVEDPDYNKLYMYFISLKDEHMFLHTDFKKTYDEVMSLCLDKYEYVKLHSPEKVTFVLEISDFYDVDKYVKMFMHMFGIENTRGGSYTDITLSESFIETINHEKEITSIEYYLRDKNNKA